MSGITRFTSVIRDHSSFTLTIFGFSVTISWNMILKVPPVKFVVSAVTLAMKFVSTLRVPRIKFTITSSLVKLRTVFTATVNVKKISLTAVMHQIVKMTETLSVKKITINAIMHLIWKFDAMTLRVSKIRLVANPIVAVFTLLSTMDSGGTKYLSDYDGEYLSTLDYTEI